MLRRIQSWMFTTGFVASQNFFPKIGSFNAGVLWDFSQKPEAVLKKSWS